MQLAERMVRYAAIEAYRKRPLIIYATSTRPGVSAHMAGDAVREFVDQIDAIPAEKLLRERFENVGVLVPFMAFSAATLFALGADKIVMHPHASLGPIDPQVAMKQSDGTVKQFAYEDVGAFLRFLVTDAKITEQAHTSAGMEKLFSVVDPVGVGAAKRASELASSIGERLLRTHMTGEDKFQAKEIAENLNKTFFAHGDAVSRTRANELHLKIAEADPEIENLIWQAYVGLEAYLQLRIPFDPLQHYLSNPAAAATLVPLAPAALPANTPPQVATQIWQAIGNQAIQNHTKAIEVPFTTRNAVIESTRVSSEHRADGKISASVLPNGEVRISMIKTLFAAWSAVASYAHTTAQAAASAGQTVPQTGATT